MERSVRPSEGAVAGIGATVVALAFLGLAHVVQPSVPFPPAGIAQRAVQVIPGSFAVDAIELLGHWALRLFIIGVGIATLVLGGALGAWAANRDRPAAWLPAGLLGGVALAGWQPGPGVDFLTYAVLCAIAAALWGLQLRGSLTRLRAAAAPDRAAPEEPESARDAAAEPAAATPAATPPVTPAGRGVPVWALGASRRELLRAGAGAGGLLLAGLVVQRVTGGFGGGGGGGPIARPAGAAPVVPAVVPAEPEVERATFASIAGLSPELTANRDHYVVDESIIDPDVDAGAWRLRIDGLVGGPVELTYDDLLRMPATEEIVTLVCISNYVGGDLAGTAKWTGVPLADVLQRAGGVKQGAVRVAFHAVGGYTDSLPVAKALDRATVVAYGMNGTALPRSHGYPARIVAPGIYGMKNVKWLERIEVVDYDFEGYWQAGGGWDNIAEIRTESRIDVPTGGFGGAVAVVGAGELVVAGVAWAGARGVERVEVSVDDGRTWRQAQLRRELAPAAWRQWYLRLPPAPPGNSTILVRATDGTGVVQTQVEAPPHPSGATGWDEVRVKGA